MWRPDRLSAFDGLRSWLGLETSYARDFLDSEVQVPEGCSADMPWIRLVGSFGSDQGKRIRQAYAIAESGERSLPDWISSMEGMSGSKFRTLLNQLVAAQPNARYLEVGSWKGSTACSAIYGNHLRIVCVDNWSLFGGPRHEFFANIGKCISDKIDFSCIEEDYRNVDFTEHGTFNIYFYDGPHDEEDQYDGQLAVEHVLDTDFCLVVDDWNWLGVRKGTKRALRRLGIRITSFIEIRTSSDNQHVKGRQGPESDWHNGYFIAACRRR